MRLLILGGSGGIGRWLVRLAAQRGHDVTALVRGAAALDAPAGVRVVRGEATDERTVASLLEGRHAVLSSIGLRRANPSPWARLRSPTDLVETVTRNLLMAMPVAGVRRLVFVSAGGVGDSAARATTPVRWLITRGSIAVAYADLARAEAAAAASALDWLAVRPVTLVPGAPTGGGAREVDRYRFFSTVRRGNVAAWMLDAVERPERFTARTVLLG